MITVRAIESPVNDENNNSFLNFSQAQNNRNKSMRKTCVRLFNKSIENSTNWNKSWFSSSLKWPKYNSKHWFLPIQICPKKLCNWQRKITMKFQEMKSFYLFIFRYSTAVTESEAKYFKKLIYSIASSDTFSVSTMQAIHFSSDYKITKQNAQQLLNEWSEKGYLNETADSFQLGPRTIGEFGDALHQIHDGLRNCSMCRQILFNGIVCPHGCECIMHKICTEKYFKTGKRCLVCKKEWNKNENKEDTAKETQPKRRSRRNKNNES